jgi:hypothetical protein
MLMLFGTVTVCRVVLVDGTGPVLVSVMRPLAGRPFWSVA